MPRVQRLQHLGGMAAGWSNMLTYSSWWTDVLLAAMFDALSDTISDEVVDSSDGDDGVPESVVAEKQGPTFKDKLSGFQDVMVSSCSAFIVSSVYIMFFQEETVLSEEKLPVLCMALFAGIMYGMGSISIMTAFEHLPSTTVVPLSQMTGPMVEVLAFILSQFSSTHWLLKPFASSSLSAAKCAAFLLIFVGSMVPCASAIFSSDLGPKRQLNSVLLVLFSNLCWGVFTLIMSCATSTTLGPGNYVSSGQFVVLSNLASCAFILAACSLTSKGRQEALALRTASPYVLVMCSVSEISNYLAITYFSFAVKAYDNEGIVLAARLGLHQISNFALATTLHWICAFGRPPEKFRLKIISAVLVCTGLYYTP